MGIISHRVGNSINLFIANKKAYLHYFVTILNYPWTRSRLEASPDLYGGIDRCMSVLNVVNAQPNWLIRRTSKHAKLLSEQSG